MGKIDDATRRAGIVPAFCPICEGVMKGSYSNTSFYRFGCCSDCHLEFVEDREERWREGWRPDEERLKMFLKKRYG